MQGTVLQPIHQVAEVTFRYPIFFTHDLFAPENSLLIDVMGAGRDTSGPSKAIVVLDRGLLEQNPDLLDTIEAYAGHHRTSFNLVCPPLVVEGGEQVKNDPGNVASVHRGIHEFGIDRHSYVVAVGGGAVIDMVGYAAATAHRGVRLIRVPTTVLSQNDSGVGVKNSVNAFGKKNFLGTFAPPYAVLNDLAFLTTLSDRDWRSGISEAIKVALLKDADFFAFIEEHAQELNRRDMMAMEWLVYRCAQLHLEHIATGGDPFEFGSSRPLDFGHWAAHKLEQLTDYSVRHGEAVAIGIALDSTYAHLMGLLPEADWRRILRVTTAVGLPVYVPELSEDVAERVDRRSVLSGLNEFREHLGGQLTIMLLERIGRGVEVHEMDEDRISESIRLLKDYQANDSAADIHGGVAWPRTSAAAP
ncbi:MAG: 3-dehydroquinate synthase [Chloroflexota bacterium]|nr:3-dehydroquinate synthase [Chloroflexota bacterium]